MVQDHTVSSRLAGAQSEAQPQQKGGKEEGTTKCMLLFSPDLCSKMSRFFSNPSPTHSVNPGIWQ